MLDGPQETQKFLVSLCLDIYIYNSVWNIFTYIYISYIHIYIYGIIWVNILYIYIYIPILITSSMVLPGSSIHTWFCELIGFHGILHGIMIFGGGSWKPMVNLMVYYGLLWDNIRLYMVVSINADSESYGYFFEGHPNLKLR